jgi:hypothetical protein
MSKRCTYMASARIPGVLTKTLPQLARKKKVLFAIGFRWGEK